MSFETAVVGDRDRREADRRDKVEQRIAVTAANIVDLVLNNPRVPRDELDAKLRAVLRELMSGEGNNG